MEAARPRTAAGDPEHDRPIVLADLATRLTALLRNRHPESAGEARAKLRRLLDETPGRRRPGRTFRPARPAVAAYADLRS